MDNILVGDKDGSPNSLADIRLIDFGLCSSYLTNNGQHIDMSTRSMFLGNIAFGSVNAMNFKSVSRRDDLISLTYLLVYMIQGSLSILNVGNLDKHQQFEQICMAKNQLTPQALCKSRRASPFLDFVMEVHCLAFDQQPDYNKLRFMLLQIMIENNLPLSNDYDWSVQ